jgi:hypothetical protein
VDDTLHQFSILVTGIDPVEPEPAFVIPGRRQRIRAKRGPVSTNPESILTMVVMDAGFARSAQD